MSWKTIAAVLLAMGVGIGVLFSIAFRIPAPPQHEVFVNGQVLTMDTQNTIVEAISIRNGKVEAIGTTGDIMAGVGDQTTVNDLRGRTLMPGFIDAHGHFPGSGLTVVSADITSPPVGIHTTMAEVMATMKRRAEQTDPGEWVTGFGYDDTLLIEQRHPSRAELDAVSSEHPVAITHVSGHMLVANSMALASVGIDANTPDPEGGVIGRRAGSREPNGLLEETARMDIMNAQQASMGVMDFYKMVKYANAEYAALGVTTAQSGGVTPAMLEGLVIFSKYGLVQIRMVLFAFEDAYGDKLFEGAFDPEALRTDMLTAPAVKIVADGSIQGYTGYLSQPYHVAYHGDESYRGYPAVLRDNLFETVEKLHRAGFQLAIHGNGDESIEDILDAFEAAQKAHPVADPRLILIHSQMARKDQIARMKALGVTPSFFTAHTWYWGDRHRDIFMGPERAANMSPGKWAQDIGLRYSSHLDTPVVPMAPLQAVWSMVHRGSYGGDVIGSDQRVGVMEALRAVTIDAAWQIREEDNRGSLEAGKWADIVVLDDDPLTDTLNLREIEVERTLVGGVTIYKR